MLVTPLDHRVLIRKQRKSEKTAGGIIIPEETRKKEELAEMEGYEVVKLGEAAFLGLYVKPQAGDTVFIARYAGSDQRRTDDKYEYRIVNEADIVGIDKDIDIEKTIEENRDE